MIFNFSLIFSVNKQIAASGMPERMQNTNLSIGREEETKKHWKIGAHWGRER